MQLPGADLHRDALEWYSVITLTCWFFHDVSPHLGPSCSPYPLWLYVYPSTSLVFNTAARSIGTLILFPLPDMDGRLRSMDMPHH